MEKFNVKKRSESGKGAAKKVRSQGLVPAVIYGDKKAPATISMDPVDFLKRLSSSQYKKNQLFEITIEDGDCERVIAKDIVVNNINNQVVHVDFFRVQDDQPIQVHVPIRVAGVSRGQKLGGVLVQPSRSVLIECLPGDIPVDIEVLVTELTIGENIRAKHLTLTGSRSVLSNPNDILVKVESTKLSKSAVAADEGA